MSGVQSFRKCALASSGGFCSSTSDHMQRVGLDSSPSHLTDELSHIKTKPSPEEKCRKRAVPQGKEAGVPAEMSEASPQQNAISIHKALSGCFVDLHLCSHISLIGTESHCREQS